MWCNMHKNKYVKNDDSFSCEKARGLMFAELDGETSAKESEKLSRHLEHCEKCRKEFDERKAIMEAIHDSKWSAPSALKPNVMALIDVVKQDEKIDTRFKLFGNNHTNGCNAATNKHKIFSKSSWFLPLGTAVAACAAVMLVIFNHGMSDQSASDLSEFSLKAPFYKAAGTPGDFNLQENEQFEVTSTLYGAALSSAEASSENNSDGWGFTPDEKATIDVVQNDEDVLPSEIDRFADTSDVFDLFAATNAQDFPDAAILVCSREQLDDLLPEDSLRADTYVTIKQSGRDKTKKNVQSDTTSLDSYDIFKGVTCLINSDSAEYAASVFASYVKLLDDQGVDYRLSLPDKEDFTECCIVLVDDEPVADSSENIEEYSVDSAVYD